MEPGREDGGDDRDHEGQRADVMSTITTIGTQILNWMKEMIADASEPEMDKMLDEGLYDDLDQQE